MNQALYAHMNNKRKMKKKKKSEAIKKRKGTYNPASIYVSVFVCMAT
jgi:hypothetical protein